MSTPSERLSTAPQPIKKRRARGMAALSCPTARNDNRSRGEPGLARQHAGSMARDASHASRCGLKRRRGSSGHRNYQIGPCGVSTFRLSYLRVLAI